MFIWANRHHHETSIKDVLYLLSTMDEELSPVFRVKISSYVFDSPDIGNYKCVMHIVLRIRYELKFAGNTSIMVSISTAVCRLLTPTIHPQDCCAGNSCRKCVCYCARCRICPWKKEYWHLTKELRELCNCQIHIMFGVENRKSDRTNCTERMRLFVHTCLYWKILHRFLEFPLVCHSSPMLVPVTISQWQTQSLLPFINASVTSIRHNFRRTE